MDGGFFHSPQAGLLFAALRSAELWAGGWHSTRMSIPDILRVTAVIILALVAGEVGGDCCSATACGGASQRRLTAQEVVCLWPLDSSVPGLRLTLSLSLHTA